MGGTVVLVIFKTKWKFILKLIYANFIFFCVFFFILCFLVVGADTERGFFLFKLGN